ncbi:multiprotein bridging factor aMBF1 [Halosegnis sp.]|uniref:multiprotein bridging factor aMBF1 n=1 Tax=Halosegnis sp. TaxID=2864959 RepID=UPI0035D51963
MVNCEMCGTTVADPKTVKVEGAELDVCGDCAEFGTEVRQDTGSSASAKYSTDSSSTGSAGSTGGSSASSGNSSGGRRRDMFDEMDEVATDYDDRIRSARESKGLSQEKLANQLNEKVGVIRKLERGDTLPTDKVQQKLEQALGISLSESDADDDYEFDADSGASTGSYTLGDVVERKD